MRSFADAVPLFLPCVALSLLIGLVVSRSLGRRLGAGPMLAFLLVASIGLILSATLTPDAGAYEGVTGIPGWCDLSRVGFAPLGTLVRVNQASLNVLLFVPLGMAVGWLPGSRAKAFIVVAGLALPFIIEATQSLVTVLGRGCQSEDVFDNVLGFALGVLVGVVLRSVVRHAGLARPRT